MRRKRTRRKSERSRVDFSNSILEPRCLLAGIGFNEAAGIVTVDGTGNADFVQVQQPNSDTINVIFHGLETRSFNTGSVSEIVFLGRNGADWFKNNSNISSRAFGHAGNDILIGGSQNDTQRGGPGADRLDGQAGDDRMGGDDGSDHLLGRAGRDILNGNDGDDSCNGGGGSDRISGNAGNDTLIGGAGADRILGNEGRDSMFGGYGDDDMYGGAFGDQMYGQQGSDELYGGSGDDDLYGGSGSDRMAGNAGKDDYYSDDSDDVYEDDDDNRPDGDFELRGNVTNLDTVAQTFSLLGVTVNYAGAEWVPSNLANGDFVKTEGSYNGNQLVANEVEMEIDDDRDENFEATGTISNLNTTAQTFDFFGFTVNYAGADVEAALADGITVEVEGLFDSQIIIAEEVE